jgi:hypothetical protein
MDEVEISFTWAPRVSRKKILELYVKVATGYNDEDLINEVADAFYNRCSDIVRIYERRFACPVCRKELPNPHQLNTDLLCSNCGWTMPWKPFFRTYQGKQLSVNADLTDITRKYLRDLPECKTPGEKMILIVSIIHACHEWTRKGVTYYGRPLAVNFIEGNMNQVVDFIENLPYGPDSLPEITEQVMLWRRKVLSLFSDVEIERDRIAHLVDTMPPDLYEEIEELLAKNQRQKAAARLRHCNEYSYEVKFHHGDVATQVVKLIKKRMKK